MKKGYLLVGKYGTKIVGRGEGLGAEGKGMRDLEQWVNRQTLGQVRTSAIEYIIREMGRLNKMSARTVARKSDRNLPFTSFWRFSTEPG
jgi:hypothetical protein